jgi:hypothetical protein
MTATRQAHTESGFTDETVHLIESIRSTGVADMRVKDEVSRVLRIIGRYDSALEVSSVIPSDWFRYMVEEHAQRVREL